MSHVRHIGKWRVCLGKRSGLGAPQAALMLHRTRDLLIRQRTQLINALRAHLAEFGLVAATGREGLAQLGAIITDESNREALPSAMKQALQAIVDQLAALELQIGTWIAPFTPIIVPMI